MRFVAAIACVLAATASWSDERILSFHSDVRVFADGEIEVTETIEVRAEGNQIRRGIYRDFPVEYQDRFGNNYEVSYTPLGVQRDGQRESMHTVRNRHDVRTYFGRNDRWLEQGVHTYTYRYRANRLLGYFDEHDELYWNVTGNRWAFPIDSVSATVRLDFETPRGSVRTDGFTGRLGSVAKDFDSYEREAGEIHFVGTRSLPPAHGLTIVVGWPKGLVAEPDLLQRTVWLLADNRGLLVALLCFAVLFTYNFLVWKKHGKDPEEGVVVTRYEPPETFSPGSLRYIRQMYYDDKVMTAAIVNLAVKGYVTIEEHDDTHSVTKVNPPTTTQLLAKSEKVLYAALFRHGNSIELTADNHEELRRARKKHAASLKDYYHQTYFRKNTMLHIPGTLMLALSLPLILLAADRPTIAIFSVIALMLITQIGFAVSMRRPTIRGRQLLDQVQGFRDYLEVAEKDEMHMRNPPDKTPALFEAYLPYALALDVDQEWSERFARVLASARQPDGSVYHPHWYSGNWDSANLSTATRSFSRGLGSAVSQSTAAPGSSSGFSGGGGGGFSGGGGGGGGGGGW